MRNRQCIAFFERAVLLALALPGCGGATATGEDGGVPSPDAAGDGAITLPQTACDWQEVSVTANGCSWSLSFQGDPVVCAGFVGNGTPAQCAAVCGDNSAGFPAGQCFVASPGDAGLASLGCTVTTGNVCAPSPPCCNGGRRTDFFAALGFGPPPAGREVGSHFARVACMEASSVEAFRMLRDELAAHGAPRRLVRAASRAIRDELRHVRQTSALARRFGEKPIAPVPAPPRPLRSLGAMALDNAVEGCVRETYSALECAWQAEAAADPVVRATMKRITRDEMRHLALSWAVHSWAMGRLDAATRGRIASAQRDEIAGLVRELATDPHPSLVRAAGLPRSHHSRALLAAVAERAAA
ncbi:MAG TPA: ferritin-like domain-containing protein [Polyangiaceae bacterium]|jgi:hypothetical protein